MRTGCGELFGLGLGRVKAADDKRRQSIGSRGARDNRDDYDVSLTIVRPREAKAGPLLVSGWEAKAAALRRFLN